MKSYSLPELRTFVDLLTAELVGAQLQEVVTNDRGLALGFWSRGTKWLAIDLSPNAPIAVVIDDRSPFVKGARGKPVGLFLSSHGRNKVVRGFELREEFGRVIEIFLSDRDDECVIELQLIPRQANLIVRAAGKQVAWEKPKELTAAPPVEAYPPSRNLDEIRDEWVGSLRRERGPAADPAEQWRKKRDRDLEKKRKALAEIEKQLLGDEGAIWYAKGDALKAGGELLDPRQSRAWNIEHAYAKAKQASAKREGTEERRAILYREISELEASTFETARRQPERPRAGDVMKKAGAKGRTLTLDSGVVAFLGKSAADNLALLRKARAWDYWLHLRDYPGAHAILHRNRDQRVSDEDLRKAAQWLARETAGAEGRLAVVVAECRHVRPIKGDRIGRVTYHNERHFAVEA